MLLNVTSITYGLSSRRFSLLRKDLETALRTAVEGRNYGGTVSTLTLCFVVLPSEIRGKAEPNKTVVRHFKRFDALLVKHAVNYEEFVSVPVEERERLVLDAARHMANALIDMPRRIPDLRNADLGRDLLRGVVVQFAASSGDRSRS